MPQYTNPEVDPFPDATTPAEWLEMAYDSGWLMMRSNTNNRGYLANFREDHLRDFCSTACGRGLDCATWPYVHVTAPHYLGPAGCTTRSELYRQLMSEDLPTLSPGPGGNA